MTHEQPTEPTEEEKKMLRSFGKALMMATNAGRDHAQRERRPRLIIVFAAGIVVGMGIMHFKRRTPATTEPQTRVLHPDHNTRLEITEYP